jgi:hypothetical protein
VDLDFRLLLLLLPFVRELQRNVSKVHWCCYDIVYSNSQV